MEGLGHIELKTKPWRKARDIKLSVCRRYGITIEELESRTHKWRVAHPRQIAMALVRKKLGYSYPRIGREFNRDHTTALWAARKWGIEPDLATSRRAREWRRT